MVEDEIKTEEVKEEVKDLSGGTAMADKAISAAERLEKANADTVKNLDRQEALIARQALAGFSSAGKETQPKTQDDIDQEVADKFLKEDEDQ